MPAAAQQRGSPRASVSTRVAKRLARLDWEEIGSALWREGFARIPALLTQSECLELASLYTRDPPFRKTIDLGRHGFGAGEYRYFANPLPRLVEAFRVQLYPPLAHIANEWQQALGVEERYPSSLRRFLARCHAAEQRRPTPLLLHYGAGDFNRLHQDLYGAVAFPIQVTFLLSDPSRDFEGGEFLLLEQRPRMQSRGDAVALAQGEAIVFASTERPVRGSRGFHRARTRHGVSRIRRGQRTTLGIIFHDAK